MKLFVGLDVSSSDMKVCVLDQEGDRLDTCTVSNDLPGAMNLKQRLLDLTTDEEIDTLKIGLESTSVYSFHPSMFLHHDEDLQRLETQVFVMNPKQIANFQEEVPER